MGIRLRLCSCLLALSLAVPLSVAAATVNKPVDTSAQEKAKVELAGRLTQRNLALRELARQINAIPATSPAKDALSALRADLVAYQRATAAMPDSTLGGLELQNLHATINSVLKLASALGNEPAAVNAIAAMRRVQATQLDARNAKLQWMLAQLQAIRTAAGTDGPLVLVPSKPLVKKPVANRMAAREADATTTPLDTSDNNTQAASESVVVQITVTQDPPSTGGYTLPNGQAVNASQAQVFIASGGIASIQPTTSAGGVTIPTTVTFNSDGNPTTLFEAVAAYGSFPQISIDTNSYCSASTSTSSASSSSTMNALFTVDEGCGETTPSKPATCPSGTESIAGLCYTKCRAGYEGHVTMCVQDSCPSGYTDQGLFCGKSAPYGRGGGYPWKFGDKAFSLDAARARCQKDHPSGCEKTGEIIYPKCRAGYHAFGPNLCTPDCPAKYTDIGVSCKKPSYDRGAGVSKS